MGGAMWLGRVAGTRFGIQPAGQLHTPNSLWNSFVSQKKKKKNFMGMGLLLLVTFFSVLLKPCPTHPPFPPAVLTILACHQPIFSLSMFSYLNSFCRCVLSDSSLLPVSVIKTAFKPVVFIRLRS